MSTGAYRLPNYRPRHAKSLHASQWAGERKARAEIVQHTTKPLPISHKTCALVARLAREITLLFLRYAPLLVPPPFLVAQGWNNVSSIGFAPAHGDGCLALCATALRCRSEDWCYAGPKIGVQPLNGHAINFHRHGRGRFSFTAARLGLVNLRNWRRRTRFVS